MDEPMAEGRGGHLGAGWWFGASATLIVVLGLIGARIARDDRNAFERLRDERSLGMGGDSGASKGSKTDPAEFAGRCLDLARAEPDSPAALAALCWAANNAADSPPGREALVRLGDGRLDRVDPGGLMAALESIRGPSEVRPRPLAPLVLGAARRHLDDPKAAGLLAWVASSQFDDRSAEEPATFREAADLIVDRFADSPDISHFAETLGYLNGGGPPWAGKYETHLRTIVGRNKSPLVRCTASFALASMVEGSGPGRREEAERLFREFAEDFARPDPSIKPVADNLVARAKAEAAGLRRRGLGLHIPSIEGVDLDGRPIKLADFRGKVVLVSFWATWCAPCMALLPHEREILERFEGRPFAIVGVNGDRDPKALAATRAKVDIPWRSFRDERPGNEPISAEWRISGWPTLILIDREGIIRETWVGAPEGDAIERAIGRLLDEGGREE